MTDSNQSLVLKPVDERLAADPAFVGELTVVLEELVRGGAALGWVEPPARAEVVALLGSLSAEASRGDAAVLGAWVGRELAGFGYWRRYVRPTYRPHADLEKVAVSSHHQGRGIGRDLVSGLVAAARAARVEVLTLDVRGDNQRAAGLYESLGFREYGRLPRFVAVGATRFDDIFYALDLR